MRTIISAIALCVIFASTALSHPVETGPPDCSKEVNARRSVIAAEMYVEMTKLRQRARTAVGERKKVLEDERKLLSAQWSLMLHQKFYCDKLND